MEFLKHKYIYSLDKPHLVFSIFDSSFYDRADLDCLNNAQRMFLINHLKGHGFDLVSGSVLVSADQKHTVQIPKIQQLGVSPFHIIDRFEKEDHVILALTPTQLACYILKYFPKELYLIELKKLIEKQPINLKKILDTLVHEDVFKNFFRVYPELSEFQRNVANSDKFIDRSHIGSLF